MESLSVETRSNIERRLRENLFSTTAWQKANTIGVTISLGAEWDTSHIIEKGWQLGKKICVPKCYPEEKKLVFYELESFEQLEIGFYNLKEPNVEKTKEVEKDEIELLIVPGVVFDKEGYRIGFGGGYYDRFLVDFSNKTISLAWSGQVVASLPIEEHDIAVGHVITERG